MTERSEDLMNKIWEARNNGSNTEEKLVSAILVIVAELVKSYNAQNSENSITVLDKNDLLQLAEELKG